jgi:hypothetical protein
MEFTRELRRFFRPQCLHHGDPLSGACGAVFERHTDGIEFIFQPANTDAKGNRPLDNTSTLLLLSRQPKLRNGKTKTPVPSLIVFVHAATSRARQRDHATPPRDRQEIFRQRSKGSDW